MANFNADFLSKLMDRPTKHIVLIQMQCMSMKWPTNLQRRYHVRILYGQNKLIGQSKECLYLSSCLFKQRTMYKLWQTDGIFD